MLEIKTDAPSVEQSVEMLGARAVFALLTNLLFLTPLVYAREPCPWCAEIDGQVAKLQQQVDKLLGWLSSHFPGADFSVDSSSGSPAKTSTTIPRVSKTFDISTTKHFLVTTPTKAVTVLPKASPSKAILLPPNPVSLPPKESSSKVVLPTPSKKPLPSSTMGGGEGYRSVAYFVNWGIYGRKYFPQDIPADKLTHVLYSFGDNRPDGEVILTDPWSDLQIHYSGDSWNDQGNNLYGNLKQLFLLKQRNRNLKVLLSIGGWTYAHEQRHFDAPAATPQGRKKFADSCVKMIKDYGFDGIDIDWEYPRDPEQGQQLLLLLQEIRAAMEVYATKLEGETGTRPKFVLTIAAPAGEANYKNMPLGALAKVLDFINLMAYDYTGAWDPTANHQANLFASTRTPTSTPFNTASVISVYTAQGVPPSKLILGMPLYGRAFTNTSGPGQPYSGVGPGSWENGIWDYKALSQAGSKEYYDEEAGASYSYDEGTRTLVSYDTLDMARRKAGWIKRMGLGGAMWWELSGDRVGEGSLVRNVVAELGEGKLEHHNNWLVYPDSQYDNLRAGFPNN